MKSHESNVSLWGVTQYLWGRLGSQKLIYVIAFILGLGNSAVMVLSPYVNELYFLYLEQGLLNKITFLLLLSLIGLLMLIAIHLVGTYLKQSVITTLSKEIMLDTLDHVQNKPYDQFQQYSSGDLYQRITHDCTNSAELLRKVVDELGTQIIALLIAAAYMMWLNQPLAVTVILIMPIALFSSSLLKKHLQNMGQALSEQSGKVRNCLQEILQGMEMIRASSAENYFLERYIKERTKLNRLALKQMWLGIAVETLSSTLSMLLVWASVIIIAWLAIQGKMQLGELMAFFILIWRVYNPMYQLGVIWGGIQQAMGAYRRISELHGGILSEKICTIESKPLENFILSLNHVSYQYPSNTNVMEPKQQNYHFHVHDVSLQVETGDIVAITGPSGSGKSTILKLAAGLLRPSSGEVWVNGEKSNGNCTKYVSYVSQSTYLFTGTIKDNLYLVKPDASEEEIRQTLKLVQMDEFVMSLPQGIDTKIEEGGSSISEGQKQRIALARAMLSDRPVLILDEATSALDYKTERAVIKGIKLWAKTENRTVIMITHRLEVLRNASYIYVVEKGSIQKKGNFLEISDSSIQL